MTFVEQSNTHGITGLWRPRFRWQPPPTLALTKDQHILYWPDSINQSQHAFKQLLRPILYDPATFGGFRGTLLRIFSQRLANSMQVINLETVLVSKTMIRWNLILRQVHRDPKTARRIWQCITHGRAICTVRSRATIGSDKNLCISINVNFSHYHWWWSYLQLFSGCNVAAIYSLRTFRN